jgi:hypothetical protein
VNQELARRRMATEVARLREHQTLVAHASADVGVARVSAVMQVSQAAMLGTLSLSMMKREASLLVPEDAAKFDLIATQATIAMASEINRISVR